MINAAMYREFVIGAARAKYITTGKTRNITEALSRYLKDDMDPDDRIPLFITAPETHELRVVLGKIRPRCDECDTELNLQINARDATGREYPTAWVCKTCGMEYYSDKTPAEWLEELRIEARKQNLGNADKSNGTELPTGRQEFEI